MSESQQNAQGGRSSSAESSNSHDHEAQTNANPPVSASKAPPQSDKTISCISCRRRKLKCDRAKPKCGTCSRLRGECEYPERKRNLGSKRRNMKELEARLAQVETALVAETQKGATAGTVPIMQNEPDWNTLGMDLDMNMDIGDLGDAGIIDSTFNIAPPFGDLFQAQMPPDGYFSSELLALGLQEPLPSQDVMDELTTIYFDTFHKSMPIIHKYRFYASLDRAPNMRPPVCLRYAMWTMAACSTDKYSSLEDVLYERTRRYLQMDEMKGHGEGFVTVYHVQAWCITATYEARKTFFSRSWMSTGRCTRLTQMLGLQRVDWDGAQIKRILAPARDWIETEERRRAFWGAYYCDRWASSGTGWPMLINEHEILTNMPSTEDAFENGIPQDGVSLTEALTPSGASKVTVFGGIIMSATLFGHNYQHLHKMGPNERPEDLSTGEFWKRHRKMDNVLSNTFMFLPDRLRLPQGARDMNVIFLHMNIHASAICLHQAAVLKADKHSLDRNFRQQCISRSLMGADEIVNIMRMVSHLDCADMNAWTGFCLYVAGGVLVQDAKATHTRPQTLPNLDFLLLAMKALGAKHSITNHFTAQLEMDIEVSGIKGPSDQPQGKILLPNTPINGIIAERHGVGMTLDDLCSFASSPHSQRQDSTAQSGSEEYIRMVSNRRIILDGRFPPLEMNVLDGLFPPMETSASTSPRGDSISSNTTASPPTFDPHDYNPFKNPPGEQSRNSGPNFRIPEDKLTTDQEKAKDYDMMRSQIGKSAFPVHEPSFGSQLISDAQCPYDVVGKKPGNMQCPYADFSGDKNGAVPSAAIPGQTPSNDASTPGHTMSFPYRQSDAGSNDQSGNQNQNQSRGNSTTSYQSGLRPESFVSDVNAQLFGQDSQGPYNIDTPGDGNKQVNAYWDEMWKA